MARPALVRAVVVKPVAVVAEGADEGFGGHEAVGGPEVGVDSPGVSAATLERIRTAVEGSHSLVPPVREAFLRDLAHDS